MIRSKVPILPNISVNSQTLEDYIPEESHFTPALFGLGPKTVFDTEIRRTSVIKQDLIRCDTQELNVYFREHMIPHFPNISGIEQNMQVELYNILAYKFGDYTDYGQEGDFFQWHVDSKKGPNHIGTISLTVSGVHTISFKKGADNLHVVNAPKCWTYWNNGDPHAVYPSNYGRDVYFRFYPEHVPEIRQNFDKIFEKNYKIILILNVFSETTIEHYVHSTELKLYNRNMHRVGYVLPNTTVSEFDGKYNTILSDTIIQTMLKLYTKYKVSLVPIKIEFILDQEIFSYEDQYFMMYTNERMEEFMIHQIRALTDSNVFWIHEDVHYQKDTFRKIDLSRAKVINLDIHSYLSKERYIRYVMLNFTNDSNKACPVIGDQDYAEYVEYNNIHNLAISRFLETNLNNPMVINLASICDEHIKYFIKNIELKKSLKKIQICKNTSRDADTQILFKVEYTNFDNPTDYVISFHSSSPSRTYGSYSYPNDIRIEDQYGIPHYPINPVKYTDYSFDCTYLNDLNDILHHQFKRTGEVFGNDGYNYMYSTSNTLVLVVQKDTT
jgi:hypothetical protein